MKVEICSECSSSDVYGEFQERLLCSACITKLAQQSKDYYHKRKKRRFQPEKRFWFAGKQLIRGNVNGGFRKTDCDRIPSEQKIVEMVAEPEPLPSTLYGGLYELLFVDGEIERLSEDDRKLISARASGLSSRQIGKGLGQERDLGYG